MDSQSYHQATVYAQKPYLQEVQTVKREMYQEFITNFCDRSACGIAIGVAASLVLRRSNPLPVVALYMGIGGGIALNRVAANFNSLE
jgi:hypothetical protein